jgi:hypothetical protein
MVRVGCWCGRGGGVRLGALPIVLSALCAIAQIPSADLKPLYDYVQD